MVEPNPSADEIFERARVFIRHAREIIAWQPTLYANSQFGDVQRFTLEWQSWVKHEMQGEFLRLSLLQPRYIRLDPNLTRAYAIYGKAATRVVQRLFDHFREHRDMNTEDRRVAYEAEFRGVVAAILPSSTTPYTNFHCDYVAQPTNALWYSFNALVMIDDYGRALFPAQWDATKQRLEARDGFELPEQVRARIEAFLRSRS